ncbi:MAG: HDIG domain-containing protein [Candidatus Heimdallarchaeota archaeon]|nr:HDIG domain-containing protein [Candidatus Heimdallarchaeota archaeon]MCK4253400.1 HDIG domain-containing protein [Candidatus Heimdallarchaeota archaeon]
MMKTHKMPTKEKCLIILKKHNTPSQVIDHCLIVTKIAERFCAQIEEINTELVIAASMLHDIGRSKDHSIFHAIEGVKILESEKLDQRLILIVKKHIGTGITETEATKLGLPPDDYIPKTTEEIVVSYSDNLVCGIRECSFDEVLETFICKFGEDSHVVRGFFRQKEFVEKIMMKNI